MNIEYVPAPCKGDGAAFKGSVVLRVPTLDERFGYLSSVDELEDLGTGENKKGSMLRAQVKLLKFSYEHYVKVDIKRLSDGRHFQTLDELRHDKDCASILQDISGRITEGFSLGNGSGQTSKGK